MPVDSAVPPGAVTGPMPAVPAGPSAGGPGAVYAALAEEYRLASAALGAGLPGR